MLKMAVAHKNISPKKKLYLIRKLPTYTSSNICNEHIILLKRLNLGNIMMGYKLSSYLVKTFSSVIRNEIVKLICIRLQILQAVC